MNKDNRERRSWTEEEDQLLRDAVRQDDPDSDPPTKWSQIAKHVPNRTNKDCRKRWFSKMASVVAKGVWSTEEDERLTEAVELHGNKWSLVAAMVRTRNNDQCAKRWIDTLNPQIDRSAWSAEEDAQLLRAVEEFGKSWKKIVETHFPGRSGLAAKNRYNCLARTNFGALRRNRAHRSHIQSRPRPPSSSSSQRSSSPDPSSPDPSSPTSSHSECSTPSPHPSPTLDFTDLVIPPLSPEAAPHEDPITVEGLNELLRHFVPPPCAPQSPIVAESSPASLFPPDLLDNGGDSQIFQFSCPSDVTSDSFDWSTLDFTVSQDPPLPSIADPLSPISASTPSASTSSDAQSESSGSSPSLSMDLDIPPTNPLPTSVAPEQKPKQVTVAVAVAMCEAQDLQFTVQTLISGLCKNLQSQK